MNRHDGSYNGLGEGFTSFPKHLSEDCVEYSLFIIDAKTKSQKEVLARLEGVRKEANKLTERLLSNYIWQRESFSLTAKTENGAPRLHGVTNYGDSVEDEWLVVYLLRELSRLFPELWIKVVDTDGEFLLIEAANALPKWLNPEVADNRIWINNGALRIIPLISASAASSTIPSTLVSRSLPLDDALQILASTPEILIHSPLIEEEAFYRLRNYPSQISASLHHAAIAIPRKLAYILHQLPAAIAPAVEAFYLRDPIALKPLYKNAGFLAFPSVDLVTVSVRFTRVLYAQLKSQQFDAPPAWKDVLLQKDGNAVDSLTKKSYNQHEMGMKVTSGFEMLVSDAKNEDHRRVREIKILLDDIAGEDGADLPNDEQISQWIDVNRDDDERWLDINFEDFERELDGKKQKQKSSAAPGAFGPERPPGFGDAKTQADVQKMVERFEAFLNDEDAGIDGAEVDEMDYDDDDDEDEDDEDSEDEDKDVSFDENEFAKMMREMMGMPSEDDVGGTTATKPNLEKTSRLEEIDTDDEEDDKDEASQIRKVMERMETELNEAGALNLDPTPSKLSALKGQQRRANETHQPLDNDTDSGSDEDVQIDFNLARNLLESFKSQGGASGPAGNILGMMGMQLPRDEGEEDSLTKKS